MNTITAKFGGSSLADAAQFRKVAEIIHADPARRYIVASAPGKRSSSDTKVTDLLYRCYDLAAAGQDYTPALAQIENRFTDIITDLGISFDISADIGIIRQHLAGTPQREYMASRGEYLNSKILAAFLGYAFLDAAQAVHFDADGRYDDARTEQSLRTALSSLPCAVVPGFYGAADDGTIYTFSRGGSDFTGAIVARATSSELYENWTDVSGMLFTDPRIVEQPQTIRYITYRELRELTYMGASVLHEDAVFPVRKAGIPINIRNTNRPDDAGTMIVPKLPDTETLHTVTGIAGRKGFTSIQVEKSMMNAEIGFGATLMQILADNNIPFEHCPTGIDTMSVVVNSESFHAEKSSVLEQIKAQLQPDVIYVEDHLAMIAVVGHGMVASRGCAARVFKALADAGINIRLIDQGSSELNIIIGVDDDDFENAIRSLYQALH